MKKTSIILTLTILSLGLLSARAQFGGSGAQAGGPNFDATFAKLLGENQAFTAALEIQVTLPTSGQPMTMPGKINFDGGKSRLEMNAANIKGDVMPPGAADQLKAMGMDVIVTITRPDKKASYLIYPRTQSYIEIPQMNGRGNTSTNDLKVETTEIGKETINGLACAKNKVTVIEKDGTKHESTVWNATDLKKFPIKIETSEQGQTMIMLYKDVSLKKPDTSAFDLPAGFIKYSNLQEMMRAAMMKKVGAAAGQPPGQ